MEEKKSKRENYSRKIFRYNTQMNPKRIPELVRLFKDYVHMISNQVIEGKQQ